MLHIHPNARTTPVVRAEIARSREPSGVLAKRYGVSAETVRKWRKRGPQDCLDRSARPRRLPWKATEEERAVVCALRPVALRRHHSVGSPAAMATTSMPGCRRSQSARVSAARSGKRSTTRRRSRSTTIVP